MKKMSHCQLLLQNVSSLPFRRKVDLVEGLVVETAGDLVVEEDMEEVVASCPPRVCLLPLRCRREDKSVRQKEDYAVCVRVCVRVCVCPCVHVCCARVYAIM